MTTQEAAVSDLRRALQDRLAPPARDWLDQALADAATAPTAHDRAGLPAWERHFAEAGRHCGPDAADIVRVLLLHTARTGAADAARIYRQGSAAERRAVLIALPYLDLDRDQGLPLVHDALRTNDTRLLAAATGPYAARHLDPPAWRQAVLKCLFTGLGVDTVADLAGRARGDSELRRMLTDYAGERTAAGRTVPEDLHRVLALTADAEES